MGAPTDVLIVGAGPAGSAAALALARAGVRVRLVDRATFPRDKLCGDTVNPGSLALLDGLGLGPAVRRAALPVHGMTVTGPAGACVTARYPDGLAGAAITRRVLDDLMLQAAIAAGALFDDGVSVRAPLMAAADTVAGVRARSRAGAAHVFSAPVVIAADGRGSRLGAALGLTAFAARPKRWAYGAYFEGVAGLTSHGEMHVRTDGYVGVAPLPGGLANVCVVREVRSVPRDLHPATDIRAGRTTLARHDIVAEVLASDPLLRDRFAGARRVSEIAVLGPLAVDARRAGCRGLLLAGDAAGFVDPMTGDGLRFALRGGMLAAEYAMRELDTGRSQCDALDAARRREFSAKWRFNRAVRALVGSPLGVSLAAMAAAWWQMPVRSIIGVAGDVGLARGPVCGATRCSTPHGRRLA